MPTKKKEDRTQESCIKVLVPVRDALEVLNGRWKVPIIISLTLGNRRFKQIAKELPGITDKLLSKE
jgi:DNA-binding HxlR family transcriptional regulator